MSSIARRINRSQVASLFWALLAADAVMVLAVVVGWCYTMERQYLGEAWVINLQRSVRYVQGMSFWRTLPTVDYLFSLPGGTVQQIQAGIFLTTLQGILLFCLVFQALMLLLRWQGGKRQTIRLLDPLHQMSQTAQQLSQVRFDEQKYHDLEEAIAAISPTTPDAKLSTGDSDLQGLENAVNSLLGRMQESYRQQNRFVSDASHELRTPISVIKGYAQMLERWGKDDPKVLGESIAAIRSEADNMQQLVEQMLFLARGDAGRNLPQMKALDLSRLMQEVYEEYLMIDKEHLWRIQASETIPAVGDPQLLKQTARILCDNAAKYSPQGGPITLRAFLDEAGVPCLSVQDNGMGIAPQDIPHIFERFYRADRARGRQTGGTGLGLSIAKWIVDRHKGYLQVVSREGVGTRMVVCLTNRVIDMEQTAPASGQAESKAAR
ncbi:MAG: sensor histidine kinase [Christensenellales bacterium]